MNKYAIYTDGLTYPVLEKDGQYYIGVPGTGHFSGQWKFLGVRERLKNSRTIIKPEDALKITDWKFKNGSPRYQVVDFDHGSVRTWAGTSADQQLRSFDTISDSGFNIATKTDKDEEIVLEESKKYAIYATYGGDGVYNSKLVDTVDSEEQAIDRVAELQATGVGASYEEVETKNEECSQASGVASGVNGKIDSFPINPKEMERQRLKEFKDTTETLQEMALLEDYEEDETISPQKQKFIDYCKDKIEDLGDVEIYDEDYEENIQYHKLMHTEGIREFNDLYIIANFDDYENENLIAINNENKIVINTPMMDCNGYASTMQFDKIDKKFYDQLMDYWDDIYMDEMIEEE